MDWLNFELDCCSYLEDRFSKHIKFIHEGNFDSTVSDIKVMKNNEIKFYIEAKKCPSQCGQFVLFPDNDKRVFVYSHLNKMPLNNYSEKIINEMSKNFSYYKNQSTTGKQIVFDMCQKVFASWIIEMYKRKNVKFIITNEFKIYKIEDIEKNFDIQARYRIKKSGSSSVNPSNNELINFLLNQAEITKVIKKNKKLFVEAKTNLSKRIFKVNQIEYIYSQNDNKYEIRKLSKTYNANVIFSINLKKNSEALTVNEFNNYLLKC